MRVASVASFIPETAIPNGVVEARLGLEAGWIEQRTGILRRPTASREEATSDLAIAAGERVLALTKANRRDIRLLILATSTPDHLLPPTAPLVAHRLDLASAGAIDLTGACAGFLYAMVLADTHGQSMNSPVLVIAANILTRRINDMDPSTVALFSDGAGAILLEPSPEPHLLGSYLGSDGSSYDIIGIQAGGTREPLTPEGLHAGHQFMNMRRGPALFKKAVSAMAVAGQRAMESARRRPEDIDWWIPHQANSRLISDTGTALGIPSERTISVVDRYGNSSAATIPIALADAVESGKVKRGDTILFTAVGAGMLTAGVVLRW